MKILILRSLRLSREATAETIEDYDDAEDGESEEEEEDADADTDDTDADADTYAQRLVEPIDPAALTKRI